MIYLYFPICPFFGAGTCGSYLLKEFAKRGEVSYIPTADNSLNLAEPETRALAEKHLVSLTGDVDAPLIQFAGPQMEQISQFKGSPNVGYICFESESLSDAQKENLKAFDVLCATSEWNTKVLQDCGFDCSFVPQGVDTEIFRPGERKELKDQFVIYSGGKYERRKAQDLVVKAFSALRQRHKDISLVTSWFNLWSEKQMGLSGPGVYSLPLMNHQELAMHMRQTDVGLFPNRCEGANNLVMMEYMACGKPVIANTSSGQKDVLDETCSVGMRGSDSHLVEQMIESVEYLYQHRDRAREMGDAAAKAMQDWPWSRTADGIINAINGKLSSHNAMLSMQW